jgi:hypothetical protein
MEYERELQEIGNGGEIRKRVVLRDKSSVGKNVSRMSQGAENEQ